MGNICCGHREEAKAGAWRGDDGAETAHVSWASADDDDGYDRKATDREDLILLHEQQRNASDDGDEGSRRSRLTRMKRPSIRSTPMLLDDSSFSFTPPSFPKSDETTQFLLKAMGDNFVFDSMDDETRLEFVRAMQSQEVDAGETVIRQGDVGDYAYIVEEGELAYYVGEEMVGTGSRGCTFGELALLYDTPRAATVRATTRLQLYKIDQLTFRKLCMSHQLHNRSNSISLVHKLSVFEGLDEARVRKLADAFTLVEFGAGERIVNKGDRGNVFYIVKSGKVRVDDIGHGSSKYDDQILGEGECFGERALVTGDTRAANVTAVEPSSLLAISKERLEDIMGPLAQAVTHSSRARQLKSIPLFQYMESEEIDLCARQLREERFAKGDRVAVRGKLHLIQEGRVLMMLPEEDGEDKTAARTGPSLVTLEKGDYFGELWDDDGEGDGPLPQAPSANVTPNEKTIDVESAIVCLTLRASDIRSVLGNMERMSHVKHRSNSLDHIKSKKPKSNRDLSNMGKLTKYRILGVGTFGKVWLVTAKNGTTPYALKMVSKRQLLQQRLVATVFREKNVMECIDTDQNPFLLQMVSSFQDENYLYFVLELILGGELFELIYAGGKKRHPESAAWKASSFYQSFGAEEEKSIPLAGLGIRRAVFYATCIIDAFDYLHKRNVVYRDLKPENVMINAKGYCVVVDMGFAKVVVDKTYTLCGTPEYLAPEVIVNKGHNQSADYWSFACLLYELVVGQTPFFPSGHDQMSLLKAIVKADYEFPTKISQLRPDESNGLTTALFHWKDLVSRLLRPKPAERLGNLCNGIRDITGHELFARIDFEDFRNQSNAAPWVPTIVDPLDDPRCNSIGVPMPEFFRRKLTEKDQEAFRGF